MAPIDAGALIFAAFAVPGVASVVAGCVATWRFGCRAEAAGVAPHPITVLKPLCGPEPDLEDALASFCRQDHPRVQIVFGVHDANDAALAVVARLRHRFPDLEVDVVVDATPHGMNRKIANLLNMLPYARHDTLVFADSDLHVAPDYLRRVQAALDEPGVGLVTTVYVGRPVVSGLAARLGATHLTHTFLPGALLSRVLGRQDCLGSTMALTRETLLRVGGLQALSPHLADDNVLGQLVRGLGLSVALADTVPVTAVQERRLRDLWSHELRWARTIGALEPVAYAASALQYPIAWALLAWIASGFATWSWALLGLCVGVRALAARGVDIALAGKVGAPVAAVSAWLLPLRDLLSVIEIAASFGGHGVTWRGHAMRADDGRPASLVHPWRTARARTVGGLLLGLALGGLAIA